MHDVDRKLEKLAAALTAPAANRSEVGLGMPPADAGMLTGFLVGFRKEAAARRQSVAEDLFGDAATPDMSLEAAAKLARGYVCGRMSPERQAALIARAKATGGAV